jgi:uroporphyrinogen-III synthase
VKRCGPLDAALRQLDQYDWLLLTSANTVQAITRRAAELGIALRQNASLKVAAIGKGTAMAASGAGLNVTIVPVAYVAESLLRQLLPLILHQRILLARASQARDLIPDALRLAGAQVDVVDAYQNLVPEAAPAQLRQALATGIDAATFTSSSSVTHLAEAARQAEATWPLSGVLAVSIGPITSQTLRELAWPPAAEANPSDIPGLVEALKLLLGRS